MVLPAVFILLLAALSCNSAYKLDKLRTDNIGGLTIYRGTPVNITQVPFMARLVDVHGGLHCGATVISEKFLLTAAHCVSFHQTAIVGSDNLDSGDKYEIAQFHAHPDFNPETFHPDIALVELTKNLTFGKTVQPIALAEPDIEIDNDTVFETMGFGSTEYDTLSQLLLKVELPYSPVDYCTKTYSRLDIEVTDDMICAGGTGGRDTCSGDSGGPLVYNDTIVGVTSFGFGCGHKGIPGIYARVSALRSFIDSIVN